MNRVLLERGHYGSFLLPDFDRVEEIAKALGSDDVPIPFTVKIRLLPAIERYNCFMSNAGTGGCSIDYCSHR